jgi:glycosyltransferase involved in cell wall biosynthesis
VTHPSARLTLAGRTGAALAPTTRLASELGIAAAISIEGFLGHDEKRRALADHDLFLSTNVVDNAPVAVLEAARCGLVVVATANGGMPDLLTDGVNALVVADHGDVGRTAEALAVGARRALGDPQFARTVSTGAQELGQRSERALVVREWEDVIERARRTG